MRVVIYNEPRIIPMGDSYLVVEYGDEADLALNFRILALRQVLEEDALRGVCEIMPTMRSLAIIYDRAQLKTSTLVQAVGKRIEEAAAVTTVPSRLITLPAWYDDPWTREVAERNGVRNNFEFVAEVNGLTGPEFIEYHTATEYWVAFMGAFPGVFFSYALDRSKALTTPKYQVPRTWSPSRAIGMGGLCTAIHPMETPGGYQLVGRIAVDIYDPAQRHAVFGDGPYLGRPTDRHRYVAITPEEYEEIWGLCQDGKYDYAVEDDMFDTETYLATRSPFRQLPNADDGQAT